ncbi:hypothetical protein [Goodfellowiella coeruleoviolacea]|uniref:Uncharacterized protein n=1 Tax=Goodfellowiella coeruleoviolacea TaxID=334858 RepID=A0AAE3KG37_9PSEU|nr:hypothetical protein [Goodfellowiella coeruleoviolacea]MCP2165547.1 hypothetical protein [Goodfellowiella coeruleoviolacea]
MESAGAGNAPSVALTHVVALYDPADGRVVHLHHVVVLEGGRRISREEAERQAVVSARESGHESDGLRSRYLETPLPEGPGVLHVDTATGRVHAAAPDPAR